MAEEFKCVLVNGIRFGKGKRFAPKASKALAQSVVESLKVRRFPTRFANGLLVCAKMTKNLVIGFAEVTEGGTVAIRSWNPGPESPTALFPAVAKEAGDKLPGASTARQPNPTLMLFGADEASQLV